MSAPITLIIGFARDEVLESLGRLLAGGGREVVNITDLATVGLTVPIHGAASDFAIEREGRRRVLDTRSSALFAYGHVGRLADPLTSAYRSAESYCSWFTFLSLFGGRVVNRPHRFLPPVHSDPLLGRSIARASGVPAVADLVSSSWQCAGLPSTHAVSDLVSGLSVWMSGPDTQRGIVSHLDYSQAAEHAVALKLPKQTLVLTFDNAGRLAPAGDALRPEIIKLAETVCQTFELSYAYACFIRQDRDWKFSRLFTSPPRTLDPKVIETASAELADWLAADG